MVKKINLAAIRIDGGTQSRVEINTDTVSEYADAIRSGAEMPPVVVFHDGADHWLADGFHRFHAHRSAEKVSIAAEVRDGTKRDAVLFSLGANGTHGMRRTNADKRKAVETMLADSDWSQWSDNQIAKTCGVSQPFASSVRSSLQTVISENPAERTYTTKHGTTAVMKTDGIGKTEKKPTRTLDNRPADVAAISADDELRESSDTIAELARQNDELRDRLAVESMDVSEEEKTAAAETIRELRAQVKAMEAELDAVKASRDTYMRENAELKKQINYLRKQADKAAKVAA